MFNMLPLHTLKPVALLNGTINMFDAHYVTSWNTNCYTNDEKFTRSFALSAAIV